jgi:hypothetical protein
MADTERGCCTTEKTEAWRCRELGECPENLGISQFDLNVSRARAPTVLGADWIAYPGPERRVLIVMPKKSSVPSWE